MKKTNKPKFIESLFEFLVEIGHLLPQPLETPYAYIKRAGYNNRSTYYSTLHRLRTNKLLETVEKNGRKLLKLTKKGELHALLALAKMSQPQKWDGKWRVIIYDIPEQLREKRSLLRRLLKHAGFKKLQASVFISPQPVNRRGIEYLKRSGLINYIRFLRIDELDDDLDLLTKFHLQKLLKKPHA